MQTETDVAPASTKVSCHVVVTVWQDKKFRMIVTLLDKRTNAKCDYTLRAGSKELYIDIGNGWHILVRSYHNAPLFSALYTDLDDNEFLWKDNHEEIPVPWGLETSVSFEMEIPAKKE